MRTSLLFLGLGLCALAGCAEGDAARSGDDVFPLAGDEVRSVTERSVRLDGRTLVLDAAVGSLTIVGADTDRARLRFERVARGTSETTAQKRLDRMTIDEAGDGEIYQYFVRGGGDEGNVHVEAIVPHTAALNIRLGDGPVRLSGTTGEVAVTAENGPIEARGLAGLHVTLRARRGNVEADFTVLPVEADVRLVTESGNVVIGLPLSADVTVAAETATGTIAFDRLPFESRNHDRNGASERFLGRIGQGIAAVRVTVGVGAIRLEAGRPRTPSVTLDLFDEGARIETSEGTDPLGVAVPSSPVVPTSPPR